MDESPIDLSKLDYELAKSAKNRAAGIDDIPTEAWQWLGNDDRALTIQSTGMADCSGRGDLHWTTPTTTLLSTAYKLLARILQQMLAAALDQHLRSTQYGFRIARSTSQPAHVIRRLLERAERGHHSLYILLLDEVSVKALQVALTRCGVPEGILNLVINVHSSQLFQVKVTGQTSEILEARPGIRRGCPLSPYLFLIVHSMILCDVDKQLLQNGGLLPWVFSQQTPFYDLAYADDTALIAGTAQRTEQLLTLVENTATHSDLQAQLEQVPPPQVPFLTEPRLQTDSTRMERW